MIPATLRTPDSMRTHRRTITANIDAVDETPTYSV